LGTFHNFAASLLDASASALAGQAANVFLEENPGSDSGFGDDSFSSWRASLTVRVRELAVALEFDAPELFVAAIQWSRTTFATNGLSETSLRHALEALQHTVEQELPETAASTTRSAFNQALKRFAAPAPLDRPLDPGDATQKLALQYIETCLSGQPHRARETLLQILSARDDMPAASEAVVSQALREVGRLWHNGKLGVHEEHLVTTTTLSLLTQLTQRPGTQTALGRTVVGAAVGDNAHDLGVRLIMDSFTMSGWHSICLGGLLPASDIARATRDFEADLLVLSATLVTHLVAVRDTIEQARQVRPDLRVLVGGLAIQAGTDLWRKLGADASARNAHDAVLEGRRLFGAA